MYFAQPSFCIFEWCEITYVTAYLVIIQRRYVGLQLRANALGSKKWVLAPFCRPDIGTNRGHWCSLSSKISEQV